MSANHMRDMVFVCFVIHFINYESLLSWTINQRLLMFVDLSKLVVAKNVSVMLFFSTI